MKLLIAIPIVTLMVGVAALWISTGAVVAGAMEKLCWLQASCDKL